MFAGCQVSSACVAASAQAMAAQLRGVVHATHQLRSGHVYVMFAARVEFLEPLFLQLGSQALWSRDAHDMDGAGEKANFAWSDAGHVVDNVDNSLPNTGWTWRRCCGVSQAAHRATCSRSATATGCAARRSTCTRRLRARCGQRCAVERSQKCWGTQGCACAGPSARSGPRCVTVVGRTRAWWWRAWGWWCATVGRRPRPARLLARGGGMPRTNI